MSRNAWEANESLDTITVTLTNDDYWRIRQALAESATMHQKAVDRCTGTNQRSTDVILQHEHIMRRLQDVEDKLKEAADKAYAPPCDVVEGCQNPSIDCVGGEVYYCAEHEGGAYDAYQAWQASPERAQRVAEQS